MSRVGIYGGTFDPIHLGHLHVIAQLFEKNLVDELLVIPAGEPLLREHAPQASGAQRRRMCELAIATLAPEIGKKISVNPIEVLREGPSYAIDTVEAVSHSHPGDQIFLIMGADAFAKLDQWHRSDDLKKMVSIICIDRPGYPSHGIDIAALEVAATTIRQGSSAEVTENVAAFIRENALYDNQ